jgi:ribonucleoside-diphosphate reductase alpha chain
MKINRIVTIKKRKMDASQKILSELTVYMKYAKYVPELNRRETWDELVTRNMDMHIKKYPTLESEIREVYKLVYDKKVLPSMRSLQFGGRPIEISPNRVYNCSYLPIDHLDSFAECMFLLLGGTGVGYSVQKHHVDKLPEIRKPSATRKRRYLVGDSIEGWADAVRVLIKSYFGYNSYSPKFDFSDIRQKGAQLITVGGKAPGPEPLKIALTHVQSVLDLKNDGERLTTLECHDIICHLADAVLSGGIRRAALISLFNLDDEDMLTCKFGSWWENNPQRGRANNSAVLLRSKIDKPTFLNLWKKIELSNSGEPGFLFTNDKDAGTNPCAEINLKPNQFCNLCEINASDIDSQKEYNARAKAAAFIGTLQASYTDFHYLRDIWRKTTEKEALLGIGMTGIASGAVFKFNMEEAAGVVVAENERVAGIIGINKAARTTTVKPAGTTSLVLGTSSGIHDWHSKYYYRRIRLGKNEALYSYLNIYHPEMLEDDFFMPHLQSIVKIPQKAPEGALLREETTALSLLERIKTVNKYWIKPGHRKGPNMHNVSATVNIKPNEWETVGDWIFANKKHFTALSFLPESEHTYIQTPFETITKEEYEEAVKLLHEIDLTKVIEITDNTLLMEQAACAGNNCEIM